MSTAILYSLLGVVLFCLGLYALIKHAPLLRKIIAINIMGSGIFLVLIALANRFDHLPPDPIPHAMVITGIVGAISATALALTLLLRLNTSTGCSELPSEGTE